MSNASKLLIIGWKNLWRNKALWVFSSFMLIEPLIRLVMPNQEYDNFLLAIINFIVLFVAAYFLSLRNVGVPYISYCIAIEQPVNMETAYQISKKMLFRVLSMLLALSLTALPYFFTVFVLSVRFPQLPDFTHMVFLAAMCLSAFTAVLHFAIIETIICQFTIDKILKNAWKKFFQNFAYLATIGVLLAFLYCFINVSSIAVLLTMKGSFEMISLNMIDLISILISFEGNSLYELLNNLFLIIWATYSTSVFTVAYVKISGVKNQNITDEILNLEKKDIYAMK